MQVLPQFRSQNITPPYLIMVMFSYLNNEFPILNYLGILSCCCLRLPQWTHNSPTISNLERPTQLKCPIVLALSNIVPALMRTFSSCCSFTVMQPWAWANYVIVTMEKPSCNIIFGKGIGCFVRPLSQPFWALNNLNVDNLLSIITHEWVKWPTCRPMVWK